MITRGGSHSAIEIPQEVEELNLKHENINIQYAWPFDTDTFALYLATHVRTFDPDSVTFAT